MNQLEPGGPRKIWLPLPSVLFAYFIVTVVAPWTTLVLDFGLMGAWKFARVYSNLFLYPVLFGIFLMVSHMRTAQLLWTTAATRRAWPWLCSVVVFGLALILVRELFERPAPFEYRRDVLSSWILQPQGIAGEKTALEHVLDTERSSDEKTEEAQEQNRRVKGYAAAFLARLPDDSLFVTGASLTKWTYLVSTTVQTMVMASVFLALGWALRLYTWGDRQYMRLRKLLISTMLITVLLALPWLLMRQACEHYQQDIYEIGSRNVAAVLSFPFLLATFYLVAVSWVVVGKRVEPILAAMSSLGIVGLILKEDWLRGLFPPDAGALHYLIMFGVVVLVLSTWVIPAGRSEKSDGPDGKDPHDSLGKDQ